MVKHIDCCTFSTYTKLVTNAFTFVFWIAFRANCVVTHFNTLLFQHIQGTLTVPSAYSTPFELICGKCNFPIAPSTVIEDTMVDCIKCKEKCDFIYSHRLNCIIRTVNNTVLQCCLRNIVVLKQLLPQITELSYEDYLKKNPATIYMLVTFECMVGLFSMRTMKSSKLKTITNKSSSVSKVFL